MRPLLLILPLCAAVLTGCGTILSTPLQKVHVTSRPAGAEVRADGRHAGTTPTTVELSRWEDHEVTVELRGYRPYQVRLVRHINPWIGGNIANGFLVGAIVDSSTGAIYKLDPAHVHADLFPSGVRRRAPRHSGHGHARAKTAQGREFLIAVTDSPQPHWEKIGQLERE